MSDQDATRRRTSTAAAIRTPLGSELTLMSYSRDSFEVRVMKVIAFDIETVADPVLMDKYLTPPELVVPEFVEAKTGNLKDPVKIAEKQTEAVEKHKWAVAAAKAKYAEDVAKQREWAALDPHVARVVSVHVAAPQAGQDRVKTATAMATSLTDENERAVLENLFTTLQNAGSEARFVTFNGASFDVPFIMRRALLLGVAPTVNIETNKYRVADGKSNHIDVRRVLGESFPGNGPADFAKGNLDFYAKLLLGKAKTEGVDGSHVAKLFHAGEFEKLKEYGEQDAALTLRLYDRVQGFYFV